MEFSAIQSFLALPNKLKYLMHLFCLITSHIGIDTVKAHYKHRRWAGKTSYYVHLAPEHEYRTKHLMKANKN